MDRRPAQTLAATISGSFHRHLTQIFEAVGSLQAAGITVLSPSDPRVVDSAGDFLFVASDRIRSTHLVQERHFQCIKQSSFLLLVAPDGYVGQSAAMEIGFAVASSVPVYCERQPDDTTLSNYVTPIPNIQALTAKTGARKRVPPRP